MQGREIGREVRGWTENLGGKLTLAPFSTFADSTFRNCIEA